MPLKHAFLILTYSQPEQVLQQVLRMMSAERQFYIHINRKTVFSEDNAAYMALLSHPQVMLIKDRIPVRWGSFLAVEAHLALIEAAVKDGNTNYLHLISGECLPIKTPAEFNAYLEANKGGQFINHWPMPTWRKGGWGPNRLDKFHFYEFFDPRSRRPKDVVARYLNQALRVSQRVLKKIGIYRRYPASLPPVYVGSTWWTLTVECCAWCLRYIAENPAFVWRFRFTQYPEEMFFHTMLMSSPFKEQLVADNLRFIEFANPEVPHATSVTMKHLPALAAPQMLIARKFTNESAELIEHLTSTGVLNRVE